MVTTSAMTYRSILFNYAKKRKAIPVQALKVPGLQDNRYMKVVRSLRDIAGLNSDIREKHCPSSLNPSTQMSELYYSRCNLFASFIYTNG
jgi:hypothetical protein